MKKVLLIVLSIILMNMTVLSIGSNAYFVSTPTISPDGKQIVFSYEKDLWIINSNGGTAYRLTGMEGIELNPRFSPDGKWIAFSGNQEGNNNVYIMSVAGGPIKQLTFHDSGDLVDSWSWDSMYIYFNSSRYNNFSEYKVSIKGGTPLRIFEHYFNTIHGMVEHPKTGDLYFTDTWESLGFASRKRYKGDYNPDLKSYNLKSKKFKVHTKYRGKDFFPTIDKNGNIYFISDRLNGEYNLYKLNGEKKLKLTSFSNSIKTPQVNANGDRVVFIKDYQLYLYDVRSKRSEIVKVKLFKNDTLKLEKNFNIKNSITAFDVSSDGKKIAFISRGEMFISDIKGKFIKQIKTSSNGRILEVLWLKDNKTVIFNQTVHGWQNIFKIRTDKVEKEKQLTYDKGNNRNISMDSEKKMAVYLSGSTLLKSMNLETFKSKTLLKEEIWGFYNSQPYFSPDDKFIVFTAYRNFEQDIFIHSIDTGKTINITNTGVSESSPFWSPDGKYLYFTSNRFAPSYPRGGGNNKIYRLPLHKYLKPFKSDKLEELFKEKKKPEKDKKGKAKEKKEKKPVKKPKVSFDLDEIARRWERISPFNGTQGTPSIIIEKENTYVIYGSNHDGKRGNLWITSLKDFEKTKTKKIKNAQTYNARIVSIKKKHYVLVKGKIGLLKLKTHSVKSISMDFSFRRNLRNEFNQMFYELWAGVSENFYDDKFHGIDWLKIRKYYSKFLPKVTSRSDLKILIADMLGELNASHLGFYSRGKEEKKFHSMRTNSTGLYFEQNDPYIVKFILPESPADKKGIDIKAGDILLAVNGTSVDKKTNREFYFRGPSTAKEIELSFKRSEKIFKVKLHPASSYSFKRSLYDNWVRKNQSLVDEQSNKKIAYIHMKNMGGGELNNFLVEMTNETYHRKGLILDLRNNTGGNVHDEVLKFLSQRPYSYWKYRSGKYANQPHFAPAAKPIIILINEQTLSDGEMVTAGFKALKLGKVIGTETYRWIIFTSGKGLVDGSFYRLPSWGCYTLDKKDLEIHGVKPDIYIKNTLKDRLEGRDPQLNRAIKEILKKMK